MGLNTGETAVEGDFIQQADRDATKSNDANRVPKLEDTGYLDRRFLSTGFGGDGSDGALSVSSGTTTIDLASAPVVIKQYSSISITGTGGIDFSNPATGGTLVIILCAGDCTLTSSATRGIDLRGVGATKSTDGFSFLFAATNAGVDGTDAGGTEGGGGGGGGASAEDGADASGGAGATNGAGGAGAFPALTPAQLAILSRFAHTAAFVVGAGGGDGGDGDTGLGGDGGRGGGALILECAGDLNFGASFTIDSSGQNGSNGTNNDGGGGGGGGAGTVHLFHQGITTAVAGTITTAGGTGGTGESDGGNGGAGGDAFSVLEAIA